MDVAALLRETLVWDNHACMPLRAGDEEFLPQLERARSVGVDAITLNIGFAEQTPQQHLEVLSTFRRWVKNNPAHYQLVDKVADLDTARAAGRLAVMFDIEGAGGIGDQLSLVQLYYDLGVRWMLIAYNRANRAGSGCYDETDGGLTAFGRDMVREMNRVGMTVCCTHTGHRTVQDVLDVSTQPVIFSHSNSAALRPHKRNITDDMIRACAAQGGVVGINGIGDFLGAPGTDLVEAVARQIDHVVQLVGPDHVGLSLDYVYDQSELEEFLEKMKHTFPDGIPSLDMVPPDAIPAIVEKLVARGYKDADLRKILGGSWRRIAEANWRA